MPNCRSGYKNEEKSTSTAAISYHAFPLNDATRTSQWIRAIHREGFNPTANARVCSKHFCEADYRKSSCDADVTRVKNRAGAELKLKLLKDTAIPLCFRDNQNICQASHIKKEVQRQLRKQGTKNNWMSSIFWKQLYLKLIRLVEYVSYVNDNLKYVLCTGNILSVDVVATVVTWLLT